MRTIVNAGSGGGVSLLFDEFTWQKGASGTSSLRRNVPDIAAERPSIRRGLDLFQRVRLGAALAEDAQIAHGRLGLIAPEVFAFYKTGAYTKGYFHDVLLGCNGVSGSGTPDFYKPAPKF